MVDSSRTAVSRLLLPRVERMFLAKIFLVYRPVGSARAWRFPGLFVLITDRQSNLTDRIIEGIVDVETRKTNFNVHQSAEKCMPQGPRYHIHTLVVLTFIVDSNIGVLETCICILARRQYKHQRSSMTSRLRLCKSTDNSLTSS